MTRTERLKAIAELCRLDAEFCRLGVQDKRCVCGELQSTRTFACPDCLRLVSETLAAQDPEKVAERIRLALCYGELDDDGVIAYYGPDGTYKKRTAVEVQTVVLSVLRSPSQDGGGR